MFKIGDFSKVCQVSIKSLRHWDEIDLLKPAYTDPETGYRYYHIDQLQQVNRIQALRGLGLSLRQTARLLAEDVPVSEMRGMLRLKRAELQQQIEDAEYRMALIETRLQQLEQDGPLRDYETQLKVVEPQPVYALRETAPDFKTLVELIMAVYRARDQITNRAICPLTAVFHDSSYDDTNIDIELAFPIVSHKHPPLDLDDSRRLTYSELPGVELMACTIHRGQWRTLSNGYVTLGRWISDNGYEIVGPGREIFHHIGPQADATTVTEIQFPVMKQP